MNRLKSPLRRAVAVTAGAVMGLAGVIAVAAPASAHHPEITGSYQCVTGADEKLITWVVTHSEGDKDATIRGVLASPNTPVQTGKGEVLRALDGEDKVLEGGIQPVLTAKGTEGDTITVLQKVPGTTTGQAKLRVSTKWTKDGETRWEDVRDSAPVDLGSGSCQQAPPPCVSADDAEYQHTFDGPKGTATVQLKGDKPLCADVKQPFTLVSYFAPRPEFDVPQYAYNWDTDTITAQQTKIELNVKVPDCNTQVDLIWGGEDEVIKDLVKDGPRYGDKKLGSGGAPGNRSEGPKGWFNGGSKSCQQPAVQFVSQCDGTVVVNLSNDGDISKYPVEFTIAYGGKTEKVSVKPGKGESVTVPAGAGEVTVSAEGFETQKYTWVRPDDCVLPTVVTAGDCDTFAVGVDNSKGETPVTAEITYGDKTKKLDIPAGGEGGVEFTPGDAKSATVTFTGLDVEPVEVAYEKPQDCGGQAGGGSLPVTGAAAGGIAAGAALLLLVGGVLFFLARRRRVTFTA